MKVEKLNDLNLQRLTRKSYGEDEVLEQSVTAILKRVREEEKTQFIN